MMTTLEIGPIGQIARAVADLPRAEAWYRDVLGLQHQPRAAAIEEGKRAGGEQMPQSEDVAIPRLGARQIGHRTRNLPDRACLLYTSPSPRD